MSVLRQAISSGDWDDILAQLPKEYNELTTVEATQP
jgi:uncharacterized protein (DUF2267 family)